MTSTLALSVKDNIHHNFVDLLKELKTDKYLLISESVDSNSEPSFSFCFYTELKDALTYIIDSVKESIVYDREAVFLIKNKLLYWGDDSCLGRRFIKISVGNLKDSDEKVILSTFAKANVKILVNPTFVTLP